MENIFGTRLSSARKMSGLSLQELASKFDFPITKQAISKYEQGLTAPNSEMASAFAKALNMPVDYFFSSPMVDVELSNIDYRKHKSKLNKPQQTAIIEKAKEALERYFELENIIGAEEKTEYFVYPEVISTWEDAEKAAIKLRQDWNLGNDPIADVVEMLEDKGYKVLEIEAPESFFGIKADCNSKKVIILNKNSSNIVRKRLTALHELAHHSLTFHENLSESEEERLCHAFAGAVLYPAEMVKKDLVTQRQKIFYNELKIIKERWGISYPAIIKRALQCGLITEYFEKEFNIEYRKNYLHKNEPGEYLSKEQPIKIEKMVLFSLSKELISLNEAAYYSKMPMVEFRKQLRQTV